MERAQKLVARWVDVGTRIGLALLIAGFAIYVSGLLPPLVPFEELPRLWGLPTAQFVAAAGAPTGWQWLAFAARGDYFNFLGIVLLASIVVAAYLRALQALLAHGDRLYALIAAAQVAVLLAAASGLLH